MTSITALPAAPNPLTDSQTAYNAKALAFSLALNQFGAEANQLAAEVNANAEDAAEQADVAKGHADVAKDHADVAKGHADVAKGHADVAKGHADVAAASANFRGAWADLSGPLTVPSSVYHDSTYWTLLADIADVAEHEPGVGAAWAQLKAGSVTLSGAATLYVTQQITLTITNFNSFSTYAVAASAGTVSRAGDQITYTAGASAGNVTLTVTMDGTPSTFQLTVDPLLPYIPTPAATPANFGDAFEGGFYAGMVWNQIAQSSSSKTLATGTQAFVVPDMALAPIVYLGQMLEVRSRANPANKFVGTVTGVAGTTLTLNVTSIGGSGTFSDWSVMARHRVIVAPKSSGENAGVAIKNADTALPTACQTLTEGYAATEAMKNADTSTVYPAAHWARGLNIGGRTDWYIPARDELELCWRNLKPTTTNNYVTADRPTGATPNYANNGSYGDTANTHGLNNNSSPTGAAYVAGTPAQTAATAFRTGGAEAFEYGSAYYWSSSEYSATTAWRQDWYSSYPGRQNGSNKTSTYRVRAVRRSII